jgi:hypothetical protein
MSHTFRESVHVTAWQAGAPSGLQKLSIRRKHVKERRTGEYLGSFFGNLVALVLVNMVMLWRPWTHGVVLESWVDILWAADLSIALQIVGNLVLAFYRPTWLDALMRVLFSAAGLLSLVVFWIVFPIDFSVLVGDWLNLLIRVCLAVGMAVTAIVGIVQMVRFTTAGLARA